MTSITTILKHVIVTTAVFDNWEGRQIGAAACERSNCAPAGCAGLGFEKCQTVTDE